MSDLYKNQHQQHSELIRSAAEAALVSHTVPLEIVHQLSAAGLLRPSTIFRKCSLFPGEYSIVSYNFGEEQKRIGILGFDENHMLLSIDERSPADRQLYRKGTIETPEWVEVI